MTQREAGAGRIARTNEVYEIVAMRGTLIPDAYWGFTLVVIPHHPS